ncbi:amino acid ABC transporter substrate-binding protein [Planctomonas psychrotolerans]|uniref:amino acid ABC transporter substrate-binding protein n=1 Tax=Planctomonas psychrotolerans TaxID=2528712 RepID=UPI0012393F1C|nr:amino acid ABC transporter substrate-binding protein [Planctomonas psychrotolerans]
MTRAFSSRLRSAGIVAALALTLTGCSAGGTGSTGSTGGDANGGDADASGTTLESVRDAGVITVGTEGTYAPFSFHEGGSGPLVGYDVEVAEAVAEKLGVEAEFEETQFDGIFAGLEAGRFDMIANQISINPARQEAYELSTPYTISPGVLIVAADNTDIAGFADLEGKTSAQSLTSNWFALAEENGADVEAVEGFAQAVELLVQGRVDATINDKLTLLEYQNQQGDAGLKVAAETEDPSLSAFAFRKGSTELVDAVNAALEELTADGTLASISEKYFGEDVSQ